MPYKRRDPVMHRLQPVKLDFNFETHFGQIITHHLSIKYFVVG